jgi:hypothetical protein
MRTEVDLTKLTPYQREVLAALVRRLSKNEVVRLLQIIEATAAKLVEIAARFKALQATALANSSDDANIAALKAETQKAIDAGDLAKADALLEEVESEQRPMLDRLAVDVAETAAERGEILRPCLDMFAVEALPDLSFTAR